MSLTIERVKDLLPIFESNTGNCNILYSIFIGQQLPIRLFGGTLRDFFRNNISNDIDLIIEYDIEFCLKFENESTDLVFEKLNTIFDNKLKKYSSKVAESKYLNDEAKTALKNAEKCGSDFTHDFELVESLPIVDIDISKIPNHVEYILEFLRREFKLDITFVPKFTPNNNHATPACYEDSLYIDFTPEIIKKFDFSLDPVFVFLEISKFIHKNVLSNYTDIHADSIIVNCKHNIITVINIDNFKRFEKISRFYNKNCVIIIEMDKQIFKQKVEEHSKNYTSQPIRTIIDFIYVCRCNYNLDSKKIIIMKKYFIIKI